jgi:hypothetical protein
MKVKRGIYGYDKYLLKREKEKQERLERKLLILSYYSGSDIPHCIICGLNDTDALCIDHIEGYGNKHKKDERIGNIYEWIWDNNFPDGFQTLCYNCNRKKQVRNNETRERYVYEIHRNQDIKYK